MRNNLETKNLMDSEILGDTPTFEDTSALDAQYFEQEAASLEHFFGQASKPNNKFALMENIQLSKGKLSLPTASVAEEEVQQLPVIVVTPGDDEDDDEEVFGGETVYPTGSGGNSILGVLCRAACWAAGAGVCARKRRRASRHQARQPDHDAQG